MMFLVGTAYHGEHDHSHGYLGGATGQFPRQFVGLVPDPNELGSDRLLLMELTVRLFSAVPSKRQIASITTPVNNRLVTTNHQTAGGSLLAAAADSAPYGLRIRVAAFCRLRSGRHILRRVGAAESRKAIIKKRTDGCTLARLQLLHRRIGEQLETIGVPDVSAR